MNADGVIFNNVYDNGYSNNQVIFSFRDNLKNGRLFKKEANTLASNKYPPYDMTVNYNPDRSLNVDKVHRDVARGTKEAIDFLESDIKKETDLYNKKLAQRLGYKHFTPYSKGAERARVEVVPDYDKISYPNSGDAGNEHSHMPSYLNMRHPKRVWDALTGRYFIYPTAVGTTLIGGANNDNDK